MMDDIDDIYNTMDAAVVSVTKLVLYILRYIHKLLPGFSLIKYLLTQTIVVRCSCYYETLSGKLCWLMNCAHELDLHFMKLTIIANILSHISQ